MILYFCFLLFFSSVFCGISWSCCSVVFKVVLDMGRFSVGRWVSCSLFKMFFLVSLSSSFRWFFSFKVGFLYVGYWLSVLGVVIVVGVSSSKVSSNEEVIVGEGFFWVM